MFYTSAAYTNLEYKEYNWHISYISEKKKKKKKFFQSNFFELYSPILDTKFAAKINIDQKTWWMLVEWNFLDSLLNRDYLIFRNWNRAFFW